jgi:hypothetical protein
MCLLCLCVCVCVRACVRAHARARRCACVAVLKHDCMYEWDQGLTIWRVARGDTQGRGLAQWAHWLPDKSPVIEHEVDFVVLRT